MTIPYQPKVFLKFIPSNEYIVLKLKDERVICGYMVDNKKGKTKLAGAKQLWKIPPYRTLEEIYYDGKDPDCVCYEFANKLILSDTQIVERHIATPPARHILINYPTTQTIKFR